MSPSYLWIAAGALVVATGIGLVLARPLFASRRQQRLHAARKAFHQQRERLEAKFYTLASESGKPRGLRWTDCEFSDAVTFARDRASGALAAFVGVTISFEAIEGGGMEDVEAVGNLRAATAVFHLSDGRWQTLGRVIMNLEPKEAIERFHRALEMICDI